MKKLFLVLILVGLMFMTGCAGWVEFVGRSIQPVNVNGAGTVTMYQAKDYEVLGRVSARSDSLCVLGGLLFTGKEGDALLWEEAVRKYGDKVTGLKDVINSYDYVGISFFIPILCQVERTYMATAVREK